MLYNFYTEAKKYDMKREKKDSDCYKGTFRKWNVKWLSTKCHLYACNKSIGSELTDKVLQKTRITDYLRNVTPKKKYLIIY